MECKNYSFWQKLLPPTILSIITTLFYYPSLWYGFIYDDLPTITRNINVIKASRDDLGTIFFGSFFKSSRWISRLLNNVIYKYFQTDPFYNRIPSLIIQTLSGILVFFFVLRLLSTLKTSNFLKKNAYLISILSSGLFLLHPTQTQTTTYITQMRLEGLVVLFTFVVLTPFVYASTTKNPISKTLLYLLSLIFIPFATCTKEISFVIPILVLLVDWFFISQANVKKLLKRSILHLLFFGLLFGTHKIMNFQPTKLLPQKTTQLPNSRGNVITPTPKQFITPQNYSVSQFRVILHYLVIYFWPFNLTFDYDITLAKGFWDPYAFYPFLFLILILFVALIFFIKYPTNIFSFCLGWFLISVIPRASIIVSAELVCDYKTYIGSFGPIFFIAITLAGLTKILTEFFIKHVTYKSYHKYQTTSQLLIATLFILSSGIATKIRNNVWSNELLFWKDVVKKSPNKARAFNNYAAALATAGKHEEALRAYKRSCKIDNNYAEPVINMAFHYQAKGNDKRAMECYQKALSIGECHPEMFNNLGILHLQKKAYQQAEASFKLALRFRSYYSRAHFNLGYTYFQQNKFQDAHKHFAESLMGDSIETKYYFFHADTAQKLHKLDEAIKSLEIIKKIDPQYQTQQVAFKLGCCYYEKRNYKQAKENFAIVHKQNPQHTMYTYNLAQTMLNLNEYEKALPLFEILKDEIEKFPYAQVHAAKCLAYTGKKNKAIALLDEIIKQTKYQPIKDCSISLLKEITAQS
jgi:tetratricopeptide (TPR) repeat protein